MLGLTYKEQAENVIFNLSKMTGYTVEEIKGTSRTKGIVEARSLSIYLIKISTKLKLKNIGLLFNNPLHHSTVLYHFRKNEDMISINDKRVNYLISNYNLFFN